MNNSRSITQSITAVALDMIGVLVQEEKLISRGFVNFFGEQLLLPIEEIKHRYDHGYCIGTMTRDQFWDGILSADWHIAERAFLLTRSFASDASQVLPRLAARYDLAVISDMPREWAEIILDAQGIRPLLVAGVFSNDGHGSKKDGGLFGALINALDRPASQILLVDDRPANLERAANAGITGIHLPLDHSSPETEHSQVSSLTELAARLLDQTE